MQILESSTAELGNVSLKSVITFKKKHILIIGAVQYMSMLSFKVEEMFLSDS